MMDLKHANGDPMFNALAITLMCDKCRLAGLLECPHMEHEVPHWKKDKKRGALVKEIMSSDKSLYLRLGHLRLSPMSLSMPGFEIETWP